MAEEIDTGRLEAFSDGVFAIALTLLILNIKVPQTPLPGQLLPALAAQWPDYLAFVASFATIAIMWMNHHRLFGTIRRADDLLLALNCLLLLGISVVPFTMALLASYIGRPDERVAAEVYTFTFVVISLFFNLLWRYASYKHRLLDPGVDRVMVRAINRGYLLGPTLYCAAFVFAFINVGMSIGITILLAIFFALPFPLLRRVLLL